MLAKVPVMLDALIEPVIVVADNVPETVRIFVRSFHVTPTISSTTFEEEG